MVDGPRDGLDAAARAGALPSYDVLGVGGHGGGMCREREERRGRGDEESGRIESTTVVVAAGADSQIQTIEVDGSELARQSTGLVEGREARLLSRAVVGRRSLCRSAGLTTSRSIYIRITAAGDGKVRKKGAKATSEKG